MTKLIAVIADIHGNFDALQYVTDKCFEAFVDYHTGGRYDRGKIL